MRIAVLDSEIMIPVDYSWEPYEACGQLVLHGHTEPEEVVSHSSDAQIVITNSVALTKEHMAGLPNLECIIAASTGVNHIDLEAAHERGITVCRAPAYSTYSVAQMAAALLLQLTQHVSEHASAVSQGVWSSRRESCFWLMPLHELNGKIFGLVGCGAIGTQTARIARALGMEIRAAHTEKPYRGEIDDISWVSFETLLRTSDVISLHCPLTGSTRNMIDREALSRMKATSFLINTARGELVDETALAEALKKGRIAGAGLDALSKEPPGRENPLMKAPNCFITPHIGWATLEARQRLMEITLENIRSYQEGSPVHVVVHKKRSS